MTSKRSRYLRDNPLLMKEWDYTSEINKKLDVNRLTVGSKRKVDWICSVCGHRWSAHIYNRASNGVGCPKCGHNRGGRKRATAIQIKKDEKKLESKKEEKKVDNKEESHEDESFENEISSWEIAFIFILPLLLYGHALCIAYRINKVKQKKINVPRNK